MCLDISCSLEEVMEIALLGINEPDRDCNVVLRNKKLQLRYMVP
jgi:hypothetical protein